MITIVCTVIGTTVVVGSVFVGIMNGFYKTNKQANEDIEKLEKRFDVKLDRLEKRLEHEFNGESLNLKQDLEKISAKIDDMKSSYVTNENFKTYAESMAQLLQMSTDRMTRMENTLDDIRDDINNALRHQNSQQV